jgi:hypothetical protein
VTPAFTALSQADAPDETVSHLQERVQCREQWATGVASLVKDCGDVDDTRQLVQSAQCSDECCVTSAPVCVAVIVVVCISALALRDTRTATAPGRGWVGQCADPADEGLYAINDGQVQHQGETTPDVPSQPS